MGLGMHKAYFDFILMLFGNFKMYSVHIKTIITCAIKVIKFVNTINVKIDNRLMMVMWSSLLVAVNIV